ncbi:uncharacterized protein EI90DRAFT_3044773 [Cantharellus anzutake]|uniref:uncharacterized protein n=1 Tax=Cantharellus anzutake TaxID=1750568 RepID=UPI0019065555|nr:uncharacterized protein EI90DRAFT_3044773 [Cantharellus anzutake]KAF8337069.1 hypothetical protein EI90DRAFT_3044773 [Cantharellus anzutake]
MSAQEVPLSQMTSDNDQKISFWEGPVNKLETLFGDLLATNESLEWRVRELEEDVKVARRDENAWKIAYTSTISKMENLSQDYEVLQDSLMKDRDTMSLALIDGDNFIFSAKYWKRGKDGGQEAATDLRRALLEVAGPLPFHQAILYFNKRGLSDALYANGICSRTEFEEFIVGFNGAPHFSMTDVGQRRKSLDTKIRETMKLHAHLHQTKLVLLGGGHSEVYAGEFLALQAKGLLEKFVLLKGYNPLARNVESLELSSRRIDGLFLSDRLPATGTRSKARIDPYLSAASAGKTQKNADPREVPQVSTHGEAWKRELINKGQLTRRGKSPKLQYQTDSELTETSPEGNGAWRSLGDRLDVSPRYGRRSLSPASPRSVSPSFSDGEEGTSLTLLTPAPPEESHSSRLPSNGKPTDKLLPRGRTSA